MKRLVFILAFAIVAIAANAQTGKVASITADTVNGAETIYLVASSLNPGYDFTIQALCTNIGGTSDGTIYVEGSLDGTSYEDLSVYDALTCSESGGDSLKIANAAVAIWTIEKNPFPYVRLKVVGTAADSTLITTKYNQVEPYR